MFGTHWTLQPSPEKIRSSIRDLSSTDNKESSQRVLQQFTQRWNAGSISDIIPFTDERAWLNSGLHRHKVWYLIQYAPKLHHNFSRFVLHALPLLDTKHCS